MRALGRLHPARTLAATLLAGLLLAGCGDEAGDASDDRDTTGTDGSTSADPEGSDSLGVTPQPETVAILSATAAGGSTENDLVRLDRPGGAEELTGTLGRRGQQLGQQLRQTVDGTEVPEEMALVGAVVAIGCDVPSDVEVKVDDAGKAQLVPDWAGVQRLQECFAPVTSVAIVLLDQDYVVARD